MKTENIESQNAHKNIHGAKSAAASVRTWLRLKLITNLFFPHNKKEIFSFKKDVSKQKGLQQRDSALISSAFVAYQNISLSTCTPHSWQRF